LLFHQQEESEQLGQNEDLLFYFLDANMKFNLILISLTEEIIPGAVNAKLRTGKHSIALLIRLKMYVG
jgi:hypothetical protein